MKPDEESRCGWCGLPRIAVRIACALERIATRMEQQAHEDQEPATLGTHFGTPEAEPEKPVKEQ